MIEVLMLLAGLLVLYKSSRWVVEYSVRISEVLKVGTFTVGFIFVAITTSLPELFVSVFSTLKGEAGLAVGNVIGSNISNLTLVLGLCVFLGGTIYLEKRDVLELVEILFISSLVPLFFLRGYLGTIHGVVLIALFLFFLKKLFGERRIPGPPKKGNLWEIFVKFFFSIGILLAASEVVVRNAIDLSYTFNLSPEFIGITAVALGTSLPELSVDLRSVKEKRYNLALGDLFGSCIMNITLVLGLTSLLNQIPLDLRPFYGSIPILLITTMSVWYFLDRNNKITKTEAGALFLIYALFILQELGILVLFS